MTTKRGTLYWSPKQVRIWTNGRFFDLGPRSLEASRIVADELDFKLIVQGSMPPSTNLSKPALGSAR